MFNTCHVYVCTYMCTHVCKKSRYKIIYLHMERDIFSQDRCTKNILVEHCLQQMYTDG